AQVNVYGENGHTLTFKAYNHATDQELVLDSEVIVTFTEDGSGTLFAPMELNFVVSSSSTIHNTTSGSWNDPNSWGGTVPTASATVAIDVDCVVDVDVEVANLSISDGATLTIQSGNVLTVTGDLTNTTVTGLVIEDGAQVINESANVKAVCLKNIISYNAKDNGGWYTISSPVDNMAIAGSDFLTPAYDLYRYNENPESGLEWENYKDNSNVDFTTFENGRGYLYANSNTFSPTFVGTLNAASVVRALTCSESPDGLSGFNLIGNPFPHVIYKGEGGAIDNANLASGFLTLNDEGAWHVNTYEDAIMPGQGVLVKTTANTDLTIAKSNAEATAESNGAKNAIGRICVTVTGGNGEDRAFVYFGQGIGLNKMANFTDHTPVLWVRHNNTDYAIAHVGKGCESLDLFFHNKNNGEYCLSVNTKDVTFGVLQLVDNLTGEIIDLKQHPDYSFHANGNEADGRFKLVLRMPSGVEETAEAEPFAFVIDGRIVLVGVDELAKLQVVDMTGRVVSEDGLTPGVYVLRLINGNEVRTQKIVIK
ncbi:MAG: T9SS type A sorting domain-containing protein, partial [Bacteroidales bacterium]|nr:T9SS type A sorting domain-containing protein [Bacteroidales bacterium]